MREISPDTMQAFMAWLERHEDYISAGLGDVAELREVFFELHGRNAGEPKIKYLNVYEHSKYSPGCAANYPPSKLFDSCNEARSAAINMKAKGIKVLLEAHPIEV